MCFLFSFMQHVGLLTLNPVLYMLYHVRFKNLQHVLRTLQYILHVLAGGGMQATGSHYQNRSPFSKLVQDILLYIRTMMYCIFLAVNDIGIQVVILNSYECFRTGHLFCVLQIVCVNYFVNSYVSESVI